MSPERWQRIRHLFDEALERSPGERGAYVRAAAGGDEELQREVEALLGAHDRVGAAFLGQPALAGDSGADSAPLSPVRPLADHPGDLPAASPRFAPGALIAGRYRVVRHLGRGGMGEVYEAEDLDLGERIALKTLRPDVVGDAGAVERFKREIALARRVTHRNVCRVFDLVQHRVDGGRGQAGATVHVLTMELLRGETLAERLGRGGRMSPSEALPLVRQIVAGLEAAHRAGVVHRDLKTGNVLLVPTAGDEERGEALRAVIVDFGLARSRLGRRPGDASTSRSGLIGTPAYMAPEQFEGCEATAATDIYSLGLILFEIVTGQRPFPGDDQLEGALKRLVQPPPSPLGLVPDLDPNWERAILRCLERAPEARYQRAGALLADLDRGRDPARGKGAGALEPGSAVAGYRIEALIEEDASGRLYRARDLRLGRAVALRTLTLRSGPNAPRLRQVEAAVRAATLLQHPAIQAASEVGEHQGSCYTVAEWVEGETLRRRLGRGPLPLSEAMRLARQIAAGLAAAHARGISHGRLRPDSVLLTGEGDVRIRDFGLAELSAPGEAGALADPPGAAYLAPEQASGERGDHRSDLFSLGAVMHEMLAGRPAFPAGSDAEARVAVLERDPEALALALPEVVERMVRHCLEKTPAERCQSARDLLLALDALAAGGATRPPAPPGLRIAGHAALAGGAALLVAGLLAGGLLAYLTRSGTAVSVPALRRLTYSGTDAHPALSPDGRTVAFESVRDGRRRIWLKQLTTGNEIAFSAGSDSRPRYAPDGATLLFARLEDGRESLYRMSVLGGEARKLIDDAYEGDWSPDGTRIAFLRVHPYRIGVAAADGSGQRLLGPAREAELASPRWSPDGSVIAVHLPTADGSGAAAAVLLVRPEGGESRLDLSAVRVSASSIAWLEGGTELVYARMPAAVASVAVNSSGEVAAQDVRNGRLRTLFWAPERIDVLDLGRPGQIVFDTVVRRQNLREIALDGDGLSAGAARWLTRGNCNDRQPIYSPDGERVVFSSDRSGNLDLWEIDTRSGAIRRLTDHPAEDWDPAFVPTSGELLWSSSRGGHFEIWAAAPDGSSARQVSQDGVDAENPTATADGWVVYNSSNPARSGIWKVRLDGSGATGIVAGATTHPEVSPDGRFVLYQDPREDGVGLRVVRLEDGARTRFDVLAARRVVGSPRDLLVSPGRARWLPSGSAIAFVAHDDAGAPGLYVQDFDPAADTDARRRVLLAPDAVQQSETFGLSRDGRRLVVSGLEEQHGLMLAEGVAGVAAPRREP